MATAEMNEFTVQGTVTGWPRNGHFQDGGSYLEITIDNQTRPAANGRPPMVGTFQLTVYGEDIQKYNTLAPGQQVLVSGYMKSKAVTSQRSGDTYHRVVLVARSIVVLPPQGQYQAPQQQQQYQAPQQQQQYQAPQGQYQPPQQQQWPSETDKTPF